MESLDSFGEWLRERRTVLRLTRVELAECVSCSVSALRKIEADERRPSRQLAELLANCLLIAPEKRPLFIDVARGHSRVSFLGKPEPDPKAETSLPSTPTKTTDTKPAEPGWNLPAPSTSLIGRETELASLAHLLDDADCRLLTLVGPGGIGKTRLAIEVAYDVRDRFANGVFLASLAATRKSEFMVPAIAQVIGLNFAGPTEPRSQLVNYLSNKQVLLLLDNLEHLLDGVDLLVEMLGRAPGLKLLVTSRVRLELQGEWVFEVQGLPVPAEGEVERLEQYSSMRLFLQRAQQAQVDFEPTVEDFSEVARICRLVEGMPLAIELAATWVPLLSCAEIAGEIGQGPDILATQLRDVPERQRSLQAVFDHSWKLLDEEEQRALRKLSVFRGGFRREAAEEVAGAGLPLLSALVAKSFLRRTAVGRYSLHELVRQYIAARLAEKPEEEVAARERHSAYFTDLVAGLEGKLKGVGQLQALAEIDADIDNIRQAWRWAVGHGQVRNAQKPIRGLWCFYEIRGWFQEAEASFGWIAEELARTVVETEKADSGAAVLAAYARAQQGWFCLRRGGFEEAQRLLQSSLDMLRAADAFVELVDTLQHAGALDRLMGHYSRSRARFEEMLRYATQTDDLWNAAIAEGNMGLADQALGDYQEARIRMEGTVTAFRALGDNRMLAVALHFLGGTNCMLHSFDRARAYLQESLVLSRSIGDRWIEAMTLRELGNVAKETGAETEAASLFSESLVLAREIAEQWSTLQALNSVGTVRLAMGDLAAARTAISEELALAREIQSLPDVLAALSGLARWSVYQGLTEATLPLVLASISVVLDHPAAAQKTKDGVRQLWIELEASLGPEQISATRLEAQTMSFEQVVDLALSTSSLDVSLTGNGASGM